MATYLFKGVRPCEVTQQKDGDYLAKFDDHEQVYPKADFEAAVESGFFVPEKNGKAKK